MIVKSSFIASFQTASYQIHDGQNESLLFIDSRYFLSLKQIKADWLNWKQMFESSEYHRESNRRDESALEIRLGWWNPKWISLTNDAASNQNLLDLDPNEGGLVGQVILVSHGDENSKKLVSSSFQNWFEKFADDLETGKYGVVDGDLIDIEDLDDDDDDE